jgi:hypothetical protein
MDLIVRDNRELRRLDRAIAAFEDRPCADRLRLHHLLSALRAERDEIAQFSRRRARPAIAVVPQALV